MTEDEAYGLMGALIGATSGWGDNEDAVDVYVAEMKGWPTEQPPRLGSRICVGRGRNPANRRWRSLLSATGRNTPATFGAEQEALPAPPEMYPSYERGWGDRPPGVPGRLRTRDGHHRCPGSSAGAQEPVT